MFRLPNPRVTAAVLTLSLALGSAWVSAGDVGQKLYEKNVRGAVIVYLRVGEKLVYNGSGWLIDRERKLIMTNHHVVETGPWRTAATTAFCAFAAFKDGDVISDKNYYPDKAIHGRVLDTDPSRDLAIIQLDHIPNDALELKLAAKSARPGERLHLIGQPQKAAGYFVYSTGNARQLSHFKSIIGNSNGPQRIDAKTLESSLSTNPGDSGSPVFNDNGEVLAVNHAGWGGAQALLMVTHIDLSEVRAFYAEVLALMDPKTATSAAYNARGKRRFERRENDKAIDDFTTAIRLDPKFALAYVNRAEVHLEKQAYPQAASDASTAIGLEPNLASAHVMRGRVHMTKGQHDDAITDLSKAIDIDPNFAPAYFHRGVAYNRRGNQKLAIFNFDETVKRDPTYADAYYQSGRIALDNNDYNTAIQLFSAALNKGTDKWYYNLRGDAHFAMKMYNEALRDYQDSVKVDPNFAIGWADVGRSFVNDRQYEKGINLMSHAIKIDPRCDYAYWHRAITYERLGMVQECTKDYEQAERLNSHYAGKTKMHDRCYLHVANKTTEKIRVYVRYEAEVEGGTWKWFGSTNSDSTIYWDIDVGRTVYLTEGGWKIRARRIQISAQGFTSGNRSTAQTVWLCREPYRAQAIADIIYTFNK